MENRAVRQDLRQDRRIENRRFSSFQRNVQATRRFRDGGWRPPVGYSYRRWSFGERLPPAFYGRQYWLNNWAAFALFAPPPGLVWVRYGPDAMLIDPASGEIVQVRYGVFY
jgi:Ni/Co efflux regulator RcnB